MKNLEIEKLMLKTERDIGRRLCFALVIGTICVSSLLWAILCDETLKFGMQLFLMFWILLIVYFLEIVHIAMIVKTYYRPRKK